MANVTNRPVKRASPVSRMLGMIAAFGGLAVVIGIGGAVFTALVLFVWGAVVDFLNGRGLFFDINPNPSRVHHYQYAYHGHVVAIWLTCSAGFVLWAVLASRKQAAS